MSVRRRERGPVRRYDSTTIGTIAVGVVVAVGVLVAVFLVAAMRQKDGGESAGDGKEQPYFDRSVTDQKWWMTADAMLAEYDADEPLTNARFNGKRVVLELSEAVLMNDGLDRAAVLYGTSGKTKQPSIVISMIELRGWSEGERKKVYVEAMIFGPVAIQREVWMRPWQKWAVQPGVRGGRAIMLHSGRLVMPPSS